MNVDVKERVYAYITNVEKALDQIKGKEIDAKYKKLVELAEIYLHDAKYYHEKGDYITSLACIAYAEGLIDSLRFLEVLDIKWEALSSLLERPKILVAGGFEIIHPGHMYLLKKAWELGRVYAVIARDKNFYKFKKRQPIIPEEQRLEVVENIKYVYKAILGDENDYLKPVEEIKPDIILLGPDQWPNENKLVHELKKRGLNNVRVERLNKRLSNDLYSVSNIIKKILSVHGCNPEQK
ncbi:MAG: cytidylyltransferase family protein [Staphylothermus sp.]|nr:cytidylyltransferase family protein [Staphylothermus sp.]